ncbi:2-C-methyl-D-erythritol 4-phosphate cytidylyltransferase [Maribellus sp. YY47]|uniref:2-C-methyl-D-erythritol 4-phosphate cytidylyltransferase n=1 Tax=Maribellus sp. YY47 TaxID=2929486 RepID=UPI0020006FB1|nr:2-C-methyl-D-erythritol 4-phosphate cytidylyltransferase [Maribellus sp. YY47]MCK3683717.1 2-C-methyl-D-erythritol 4-phosphate cytidylyltransferase [Maribellus sp. YY47]
MPNKFALIVAGGSGSRMNNEVPKQFLELAGKPVLMHTFEAFYSFDTAIRFVLVLPESEFQRWKELCEKHHFNINHHLAAGGSSRFESVKNGLDCIPEDGIVFIHDGVRPLVSKQTLQNCLDTARVKGNALPVVPVSESVRYIDGSKNTSLDRSKYFLVQTPQTFTLSLIKKAYQQPYSELFTDDASVLENMGTNIVTVEGNRENIKITFPEDLRIATLLLQSTR